MSDFSTQSKIGEKKTGKIFSKDYILIMFSAFASAMMNFFFLAAIPLFVAYLGGTTVQAGLFITVYSIAALIVRPIAGAFSDKYGRVKLLIVGSAICAVLSYLYGVIGVIPILLIVRAIHGVGFSIHSTCAGASIADVLPKQRLAEGLGYFALYATVAMAIAPGIAMAIIEGNTLFDYRVLFYLTAGLCALGTIALFFVSYERDRKKRQALLSQSAPDEGAAQEPLPSAKEVEEAAAEQDQEGTSEPLPKTFLGFEYAVFPVMAVIIVLYFGVVSILSFINIYARWMGFGNPGLFFAVSAVGILLSRVFIGKYADTRSADMFIIPGMIVMIICMALIPSFNSMIGLVIIAFPYGLAQGTVVPTFNAMLFKRCSAARRGTASGAFFTSLDVGFAVGAPIMGAFADAFDYRAIYWAAASFVTIALLLYIALATDRRFYAKQRKL